MKRSFLTCIHEKDAIGLGLCDAEDINKVYAYGMFPIHHVVQSKSPECLRVCIELGADVNARSLQGDTPLHFASSHGFLEGTRMLLEAGARESARSGTLKHYATNGTTPLEEALERSYFDIARVLVDYGASRENGWAFMTCWRRRTVREMCLMVLSIRNFRPGTLSGAFLSLQDKNVLRIVAKQMWSMRFDDSREFEFK